MRSLLGINVLLMVWKYSTSSAVVVCFVANGAVCELPE